MKPKLSEYGKVAEAAEILGVSQGTVRAWAEASKIPMYRNPANGYLSGRNWMDTLRRSTNQLKHRYQLQ
jgi:excisionase family DNA binding protein